MLYDERGRALIDITGRRFGRWKVIKFAAMRGHRAFWLCRCKCGTEREVVSATLRNGQSKSCGCFLREVAGRHLRTHGKSGTPEYRVWKNLMTRCYNQNCRSYARYGGRGIQVCKRWRHSFPAFLNDMGLRPSPKHQIERKHNDGNYEPSNCRWATDAEQRCNKRTNMILEHDGLRLTAKEWAKRTGIPYSTINQRIRILGWSAERALTTISQRQHQNK